MTKIIASSTSWIEGEAVRQLENVAKFEGMSYVVGMPDLHPGKGTPVGASFVTKGLVYPHLVGSDVGCGVSLWQTDLSVRKLKLDKMAKRLSSSDLDYAYDDRLDWLKMDYLETQIADFGLDTPALGTIGAGNHFWELQKISQVFNLELLDKIGIDVDLALMVVHSGSRGLGEAIYRNHAAQHGAGPLHIGTDEFKKYIFAHDRAMYWAEVNRKLIAYRFSEVLSTVSNRLIDLTHNSVTSFIDGLWVHRKGAAPSFQDDAIVIPGSRGTLSYIVMPTDNDQRENAWSVAHGAGRKWGRSDCKGKLSKFRADDLKRTNYGGYVICEDKELLYEEAPQAYKNVDEVVQDLVDAGLVEVVATLQPMITYKTAGKCGDDHE